MTRRTGLRDGLNASRILRMAAPCGALAFVIDVDRVLITHVSGSLQIARILHEVITCAALRKGAVRLDAVHVNVRLCVETCELCL